MRNVKLRLCLLKKESIKSLLFPKILSIGIT